MNPERSRATIGSPPPGEFERPLGLSVEVVTARTTSTSGISGTGLKK
jgi:hypothetical protein